MYMHLIGWIIFEKCSLIYETFFTTVDGQSNLRWNMANTGITNVSADGKATLTSRACVGLIDNHMLVQYMNVM